MSRRRPPIEQRRGQILNQLEHVRNELAAKTRKDYKSENTFEQKRRQRQDLIAELEDELSILNDPGEYNEFPVAVIADELGLSISKVKSLIHGGEIQAEGKKGYERISRSELERLAELDAKELLRPGNQEAPDIFEEAIAHLQGGDLERAEREYQRLEARESCIGIHALAYDLVLRLAKGEYSEADSIIKFINGQDPVERASVYAYLSRLLRAVQFKEHGARVIADHLLVISEAKDIDDNPENIGYVGKQFGKKLDELQQRAMYMSAVVQHAFERVKWRHVFNKEPLRLEPIIRNAIYTALYAEATCEQSPASRMFVDTIKSQIPRYWEPAKLLEKLGRKL